MRAVIQKVNQASVRVEGTTIGEIDLGFLVLLGVHEEDTKEDADYLIRKIAGLRIFEDANEKMNLSLKDVGGSILSVSQFTLIADTKKGMRPSFAKASKPDTAIPLYEYFNSSLETLGFKVETGEFGAMMDVSLTNSGPVTIFIDSKEK
ncbi:MAG: D-tyrosyl-tRNA(Tyr) deacylase [Streptococcaceae bacterium]|jgi:D-tyrosyl-tRNA(Tyr) deacylase|nr:D-tyrosyl-tRNA(Tyr) deacylase [Streptococcaceae bacterium]